MIVMFVELVIFACLINPAGPSAFITDTYVFIKSQPAGNSGIVMFRGTAIPAIGTVITVLPLYLVLIPPFTSNFVAGFAVLIPTLPLFFMMNLMKS